jgi:hypothetical protein
MLVLTCAVIGVIAALPAGAAANTTASPPSLDFGSVNLGSSSGTQTVTVTVDCSSEVVTCVVPGTFMVSGAITGDFVQTNNCPALPLLSPGSCSFSVSFAPAAAGVRTGTLNVGTDSTGTSPSLVSLSGTGVDPSAGGGGGTGTGTTTTTTTTAPSLLGAPAPGGTNTKPSGKCKKKKRRHAAVTARKRCKRH